MSFWIKEVIDDAKKNVPDVYTELGLDEVEYNNINFFTDYCTFDHPTLDIDYLDINHIESVVDYLLREFYSCDYDGVQATNVKKFVKKWELYTSDFRYIKANGVSHG
tara:strand:- start:67 stop:387 length:321 start_codon:yes stop_codon:yes gene_type:complete